MSLRRRLAGSVTCALVVTGLGLTAAAPVQAAQSDCSSGYACNWRDTGYSVFMTPFQYNISNYGNFDMHDKISSVYNNGNTSTARFYKDESYRGSWFQLSKKTGDSNLHDGSGNVPSGYHDAIDSAKFI